MSVLFDKRFMEMLSSQTVSVVGGLLAGALLVIFTDRLLYLPGMLIFIPGFLEMRGNISGTFASRLSSGLFLGIIKPNRFHTKLIHGNLAASFILALIASAVLGILAFLLTGMLSGAFLPKLIFIPVLAGLLANAIEIPLTLFATFTLFRRGHDPNNSMGPFITATGDVTSTAALLTIMVLL